MNKRFLIFSSIIATLAIIVIFHFTPNFISTTNKPTIEPPKVQEVTQKGVAYDTTGWYLYQTKNNKFFEVQYPHDWQVIYGGGFTGEEYLHVRSPDLKIDFTILAQSNKKYYTFDSFLGEINRREGVIPDSPKILKEENVVVDFHKAVQYEEYDARRQNFYIATLIFSKRAVVRFTTTFSGYQGITPEHRIIHKALLSTFRFID